MIEVQIWKVGCHLGWMPSWPGEVAELLRGEGHQTDVVKVRYSNGQMCVFKRKAPKP